MHLLLLLFCVILDTIPDTVPDTQPAASATIEVPATAVVRETDDSLSLVCVYQDNCPACSAMEPELAKLEAAGYRVTRVNVHEPKAQAVLQQYGIRSVPFLIVYRGHEAIETTAGAIRASEISHWIWRAFRGERSGGRFQVCHAQDSLGAEGRKFLQWRLSAPSCGMAWCLTHRYWEAVEVMDSSPGSGMRAAAQDAHPAFKSAPIGAASGVQGGAQVPPCPPGGCPVPGL